MWGHVADASTAIGTFVAIVGLIATQLSSRKQFLQDQIQAASAAKRSEAAARLSEEYTQRVVDALEKIASTNLGAHRIASAAIEPTVRWSLVRGSGDSYRLTNESDVPAVNVHLESHPSLDLVYLTAPPTRVGPGEAIAFIAAVDMDTSDLTITVRFHPEGDEREKVWRYPLPL